NHNYSEVREKLFSDTKERPQTVKPNHLINHSLIKKVSPSSYHQATSQDHTQIPARAPQRRPELSQEILEQKAAYPGAGIKRGEDEERLEHNGKVIPQRHHCPPSQGVGED